MLHDSPGRPRNAFHAVYSQRKAKKSTVRAHSSALLGNPTVQEVVVPAERLELRRSAMAFPQAIRPRAPRMVSTEVWVFAAKLLSMIDDPPAEIRFENFGFS